MHEKSTTEQCGTEREAKKKVIHSSSLPICLAYTLWKFKKREKKLNNNSNFLSLNGNTLFLKMYMATRLKSRNLG